MKKIYKVLLGVFMAMFLVPELLWSPAGNFVYEFLSDTAYVRPFRKSFLFEFGNDNFLSTVLFTQFLGVFSTFIWLIVFHKHIPNKITFWSALTIAFLLSIVLFFCFGLSISLRNFGF